MREPTTKTLIATPSARSTGFPLSSATGRRLTVKRKKKSSEGSPGYKDQSSSYDAIGPHDAKSSFNHEALHHGRDENHKNEDGDGLHQIAKRGSSCPFFHGANAEDLCGLSSLAAICSNPNFVLTVVEQLSPSLLNQVVLGAGLEPACLSAYAPQTYVSAIPPPELLGQAVGLP
jgi:hypothetical protein